MEYQEIINVAISLAAGVLLGYIAKWWVLPVLSKATNRTKWKSDDIIIENIKGWVAFWGLIGGAYVATSFLSFDDKYVLGIQKALFAIFIFSFTFVLARVVAQLIELKATNDGSPLRSTSIITNIAKIVVYIIGLLFLLQSMGISIAPLITALGVGGLAVALALQEPLTNLFAGIQIIASGKIRTGDYVQLNTGEEGFVEDIAWRSTSIKALANQIIIVPNNKLANAIVRNYMTPDPENGIAVNLGVAYDSDLDKVEAVTVDVATQIMKEVEGGIPEFTPFIRYNNFNQSSIDFSVIMRGKQFTDQFLIKHEFIRRLKARYNKEGINIPFPIRTVYLKTEKESGQLSKEGSDK